MRTVAWAPLQLAEATTLDLAHIISRLRKAHIEYSLRQIGSFCGVNHETIRKLISSTGNASVTYSVYVKLDEGLAKNGF